MSVIFHVSDLHFGREDPSALGWFADAVRGERPDAVIVTGDLTMRARSREFEAARNWLLALECPLSLEIGNHDLPYFNPLKRIVSPYKRFRRLERAIERPLDLTDAAIIPLRTTARAQFRLNWASGRVSRRGLGSAISRIEQKPNGTVAIVACHHPLATLAAHTHGGIAALDALAAAGADMVLSGHIHDPFDRTWTNGARSVRMIGAGTLSTRVRRTRPSFNEISVDGIGIDVNVRTMM